jgi:hypothetical protein
LKCMGALRMRQQLSEESFAHYTEALQQFTDSIGQFTYEASLICVKLGIHHIRLDQFENARLVLLVTLSPLANEDQLTRLQYIP